MATNPKSEIANFETQNWLTPKIHKGG